MLVTLHLAEGQTAKQLIGEVTALAGGTRPRVVSGRFGVLVDAGLAYRYLAVRHAPPLVEPLPEVSPMSLPAEPPLAAMAKKTTGKKSPPKVANREGE